MRTTISALALATLISPAAAAPVDPDELALRALERRAVEAVIWGMPAVNYDMMLQAALKADWDPASQGRIREALLLLAASLPDTRGMFGAKDEVDPIRHLIGTASAWGGNRERDAFYLNVTPSRNDGETVYRLVVPPDVPVDGFWSVSRYNAEGYFAPNELDAYVVSSVTAEPGADGSAKIQFGGCDGAVPNCLPIDPGWNYMVRLYRPRPELLDGSWTFPEAQPVD